MEDSDHDLSMSNVSRLGGEPEDKQQNLRLVSIQVQITTWHLPLPFQPAWSVVQTHFGYISC
jgi:hypothetical protein